MKVDNEVNDEKEINWYKVHFKWRFLVEQYKVEGAWYEREKLYLASSEEEAISMLFLPKEFIDHKVLSCEKLEGELLEKYKPQIEKEMKGILDNVKY